MEWGMWVNRPDVMDKMRTEWGFYQHAGDGVGFSSFWGEPGLLCHLLWVQADQSWVRCTQLGDVFRPSDLLWANIYCHLCSYSNTQDGKRWTALARHWGFWTELWVFVLFCLTVPFSRGLSPPSLTSVMAFKHCCLCCWLNKMKLIVVGGSE